MKTILSKKEWPQNLHPPVEYSDNMPAWVFRRRLRPGDKVMLNDLTPESFKVRRGVVHAVYCADDEFIRVKRGRKIEIWNEQLWDKEYLDDAKKMRIAGGKARWKGTSSKERRAHMAKLNGLQGKKHLL